MFRYSVCTVPDETLFYKQCLALEKNIPGLKRGKLLNDVDGSLVQLFMKDGKKVSVHNSEYIGALYVESEIDLATYFPNAKSDAFPD